MRKKREIDFIRTPEDGGKAAAQQASSHVAAGFPSPADDYMEGKLDLNEHLVKHPASTFFVKVKGDSMTGASINSGDLLLIDRSCEPVNRDVVLAVLNGDFTVKRVSSAIRVCPPIITASTSARS